MIGSIANNRFLQRVNPQISRALADSGSSLEHPEIQQLMRQMVDLGIADNLKLWVHSGLVKTRTSGSVYVPKAYDISGNNNDAVQATEANQPILVDSNIDFDGTSHYFTAGTLGNFGSTDLKTNSVSCWIKTTQTAQAGLLQVIEDGGSTFWQIKLNANASNSTSSGNLRLNLRSYNGKSLSGGTNTSIGFNDGNWNHLVVTFNYTTMTLGVYVNSTSKTVAYQNQITGGTWANLTYAVPIGAANNRGLIEVFFDGLLNDFRIFNKDLSSTEITAIYNATKAKYGH